jgi:hypothetical protein
MNKAPRRTTPDYDTPANATEPGKELFYYCNPQNSMIAVNVEEKGGELSLGVPRTLFPLSSPYASFLSFDVTPDGRRFLISTVNFPTASIPLTLVTNWNAELKKK